MKKLIIYLFVIIFISGCNYNEALQEGKNSNQHSKETSNNEAAAQNPTNNSNSTSPDIKKDDNMEDKSDTDVQNASENEPIFVPPWISPNKRYKLDFEKFSFLFGNDPSGEGPAAIHYNGILYDEKTNTKKHIIKKLKFPGNPYSIFDDSRIFVRWSPDERYLYLKDAVFDCESGEEVLKVGDHIFFQWISKNEAVYISDTTYLDYSPKDTPADEIYFGKNIMLLNIKEKQKRILYSTQMPNAIRHLNYINENKVIFEEVIVDDDIWKNKSLELIDQRSSHYVKGLHINIFDKDNDKVTELPHVEIRDAYWVYGKWQENYVELDSGSKIIFLE